jgi:ABC-2 type transport system permease protein
LSRFIFPLISLEGRKFWVLGLVPLRREQIVLGKFAFAATGSVLVAEVLILTSDLLLGLPWQAVAVHAATVAVAAIGLSALNVGLGAVMPNFRETDPSKIVVGFGGTVNMVVGLLYLLIVVSAMAVPVHVAGLARGLGGGDSSLPAWVFAGVPIGAIIGLVAVILPLRAGARALRATEF